MGADVFNPVTVEQSIRDCAERITNGVAECNKRYKAFLAADHALDIAYARAWAADTGPANGKKFSCELKTIELRQERDNADALYRHADRLAKALESELRAWQSVNKSVMGAYQVAGKGY